MRVPSKPPKMAKLRDKIKKIYSKVDSKVGGILPGGVKNTLSTSTKQKAASISSKLKSGYLAADKALGGRLVGGITPTASKTSRTLKKTSEQKALSEAQIAQQIQNQNTDITKRSLEVDYYKTKNDLEVMKDAYNYNWYERFTDEHTLRQQQLNFLLAQQQNELLNQSNAAGIPSSTIIGGIQGEESNGSFSLSSFTGGFSIATLALVGLGAYLIAKK